MFSGEEQRTDGLRALTSSAQSTCLFANGVQIAVRGSAPKSGMPLRASLAFLTRGNRPDEVRVDAFVGMHAEGAFAVASAASAPACENVRARWPCQQCNRLSIGEGGR